MDNIENAFNEAFYNILECVADINNINIEEFNNTYNSFKNTLTPEEKI